MAAVLRETLAIPHANFLAAQCTPAFTAIQILVDAVLLAKPCALAVVACKHLPLQVEGRRNINDELRLDRVSVIVGAFDGIDVKQMRNAFAGR